jgi:D-mannonate dehydratase
LLLIERVQLILEEVQPAGVHAICYRLFVNGWLRSMAKNDADKVSTHLVWARKQGIIPWEWIVDESRPVDRDPSGPIFPPS